ncbi:MAG TPA: SH3 domain-containing protein [Cytophaga sp.]|nr:SH3 domain-containing protein [Cytophaga sp.]
MNKTFLRVSISYLFTCFIAILITVLYSCDNKTADQTRADSVTAPVDTTAGMATDTAATYVPRTVVPEDTMKAIKLVYVAHKDGATSYAQMKEDAAMSSVLPYGQQLEVLEEYPRWYKVRFRNNSEIYIFYILKPFASSENPVSIKLFYPAFEVVLGGFIHEEPYESKIPVPHYYEQNGEEDSKIQVIQKDSIFLNESMRSYQTVKRIQCIPKNKTDQFIVSLAYGQFIYEVKDPASNKLVQSDKFLHWEELTPYQILPDTGGIFLPVFYDNLRKGEEELYRKMMGKKHRLKDTSMVIPSEYDIYVNYVYKNHYFCYSLGDLYLRVQRLSDGKVKETRYIIISQNEGGC